MPASATPVTKRAASNQIVEGAQSRHRFADAATIALTPISLRSGTRSGRLTKLESSAPVTKPSWTALVSQETSAADNRHTWTSSGVMAVAENHVVMHSTTPPQINPSMRQRLSSVWLSMAGIGLPMLAFHRNSGSDGSTPSERR